MKTAQTLTFDKGQLEALFHLLERGILDAITTQDERVELCMVRVQVVRALQVVRAMAEKPTSSIKVVDSVPRRQYRDSMSPVMRDHLNRTYYGETA